MHLAIIRKTKNQKKAGIERIIMKIFHSYKSKLLKRNSQLQKSFKSLNEPFRRHRAGSFKIGGQIWQEFLGCDTKVLYNKIQKVHKLDFIKIETFCCCFFVVLVTSLFLFIC